MSQGSDAGKPPHIIGPLRDFYNFESAKDKVLETDLTLEGSMTHCQDIKIYSLHILSYSVRRRQALLRLLLMSFLQRHFNSQYF